MLCLRVSNCFSAYCYLYLNVQLQFINFARSESSQRINRSSEKFILLVFNCVENQLLFEFCLKVIFPTDLIVS